MRPKSKKQLNGFTLIELVMGVVIVAVLATILLPKFFVLKQTATLNSERYVIEQLNAVLKSEALKNIINGVPEESAYPSNISLFTYLENPPPCLIVEEILPSTNDNFHWRIVSNPHPGYFIACPHFNGYASNYYMGWGGNGKGFLYYYWYQSFFGNPAGLMKLLYDANPHY